MRSVKSPQRNRASSESSRSSAQNKPRKLADLQLNVVASFTNLFLLGLSLFWLRSCQIHSMRDEFVKLLNQQRTAVLTDTGIRGNIFDRNAQILAQNIKTYKIQLDPTQLDEPMIAHLLENLPNIFPSIDLKKVEERLLNKSRKEALIARNATYHQYQEVKKLTKKYIGLSTSLKRVYPKGQLAGPFLGFVSLIKDHLQSAGRAGIEQSYDWALSGQDIIYETQKNGLEMTAPVSGALYNRSSDGRSIMTTIDIHLQQITEDYLSEQIEEMGALQGIAVVMDPHTGDILAAAQVPTYDPNKYNTSKESYQNFFISKQFEPGSTMKPFVIASALNENRISINESFSSNNGEIIVGKHKITDDHKLDRPMSTLEIIKFSSNVGAVQVGQRLGKSLLYSYLKNFGFGDLTQIGLYGEIRGKVKPLKKWIDADQAAMSYGYGIGVTPIQVAVALSAIANGGKLVMPRVVKALTNSKGEIQEEFPVRIIRNVISERVAKQVTRGMEMVLEPNGTAATIRIDGYKVAGKTGTIRKVKKVGRGYSKTRKMASFMGFAPSDSPRLAIYINIDEPQKFKYGGQVAAPVFAKIVSEALPFMGVPPDPNIQDNTSPYQRRKKQIHNKHAIKLSKILDDTPWWSKDRFLTQASEDMVFPDVTGLDLPSALDRLKDYNVDVKAQGSGIVTSQSPESGELLDNQKHIELVLQRPSLLHRPVSGAELVRPEIINGDDP